MKSISNIRSGVYLALCSMGIALSVGSWSAMRDSAFFDEIPYGATVPVVMSLTALFLAAILYAKGAELRVVLKVCQRAALALVLIYILAILLAPLLSDSERISLAVIAVTAEGVSSALLMFLFLASLVGFSSRQIAAAIASGYLLVHPYDASFLAASEGVRLVQRPVGLIAMVLIGCLLMRFGATNHAVDSRKFCEVSKGGRTTVGQLVLFGCFICVPLLIQGVYSQLTGLGSVGNIQQFGLFTELFAAGARTALLVYCLARSDDVPLGHVVCFASLISLIGIPAVDLSWGTGWYLVGSHIINSLRYVLLPAVAIVGVQTACNLRDKAAALVFFLIGVGYSCYISRLVTSELRMDFFSEAPATLPSLSLCALWIVACAIPAYLLLERRMGSGQQASVPLSSAPVDPLLDRELRFYRSVEELCDEFKLTGREREMLREVLHGYSIDSIAQRHSLSTSTVKTYLGRAYGRFGINSRQAFLTLLDSRADDGERVQAVGRSLRSS